MLSSSNLGQPVVLADDSRAGHAYEDAVARFLGEDRPMRFMGPERKSVFKRLFGRG